MSKEEKKYRVQLKPSFKIPQRKGHPVEGIVYMRGGLKFSTEFGEGKSYHIVSETDLDKLMIAQNQQFVNSPLIKELDPNLVSEEVK